MFELKFESKEVLPSTFTKKPPVDYCCPITTEIMTDPVIAADGHSYERGAITNWLANNNTSPLTGEELEHKQVIPNRTLKKAIQTYIEQNKSVYNHQFIEAMKSADYDTILHLEKLGVDIKSADENGWTLLHHAVYKGDVDKLKFLLEKNFKLDLGANRLAGWIWPPELTIEIEALEKKTELLKQRKIEFQENLKCDIKKYQELSKKRDNLHYDYKYHKPLKDDFDPGYGNCTRGVAPRIDSPHYPRWQEYLRYQSLRYEFDSLSSEINSIDTSKKRSEEQIKTIEQDISMLFSQLSILKKQLQSRLSQNYNGITPLILAVYADQRKIVSLLLSGAKENIEATDFHGATPLFWAIYRNNFELMKLLIQHGANTEAVDNAGNTLLHAAAQYADKTIIDYLLKIGFNYQIGNNNGQNPTNIASSYDRKEIADHILKQGQKLWQNMPKKLVEQDKRIEYLEQQVKILQEQLSLLVNKNQNTLFASKSSAVLSEKLGVFSSKPTNRSYEIINDSSNKAYVAKPNS